MNDKLLMAQEELEDTCLSLGQDRFRSQTLKAEAKGRMSEHGAARRLLREGINPLTEAIEYMIDPKNRTAGREHQAVKWCRMIGADHAAYHTLKVLIDGMAMRKQTVKRAGLDIVGRILDELRYRRLRTQAKGLFNYTIKRFGEKGTHHYKHKKRVLDATIKRATIQNDDGEDTTIDISDLQMPEGSRIAVGCKLLDLAITVTSLVEKKSIRLRKSVKGVRQDLRIVPTEETMQWLDLRNEFLEMMLPVALPMVAPPLPWDPKRKGGYLFALRNKYDFVGGHKESREAAAKATMPDVYAAVNAVQSTEWRVNSDVRELVRLLTEKAVAVPGFPSWDNIPEPARPVDIATNEEARRQWRHAAGLIKDENRMLFVRRMEVTKVMEAVEQMERFDSFYFPHRLDFRGRMYPIPNYLNPQGSDLSKSLLEFVNGKPIGSEGAAALAIHGANCMGEDPFGGLKLSRLSLDDRVAWVMRHQDAIVRAAYDPLAEPWWATADKPFQFYAFCCEWSRFKQEGLGFVSRLPVAIDGSCNGIQHFAAMLRDEVSGKAVNLMEGDKPEDLYQIISDRVMELVTEDALAGNDTEGPAGVLAQCWIKSDLITRKLCKRPTMTFGYGSKRWGFGEQIKKHLISDELDFSELTPDSDKPYKQQLYTACNYLSGQVWQALSEVVVSAYSAMGWLQGITRKVVTATNSSIGWRAPTGFLATQVYYEQKTRQIDTIINGSLVKPAVYEDTDQVCVYKHANAVAPNFVHSLDAAAMVLAIQSAREMGVESFGMIHDSYATVAADIGALGDATREAFVKMYREHDVIQMFYDYCCALYPGDARELPKPPRRGKLDLGRVVNSDHFFA